MKVELLNTVEENIAENEETARYEFCHNVFQLRLAIVGS